MESNDEARLLDALREYANGEEPREDDAAAVDAVLARMAEETRAGSKPRRRLPLGFAAGLVAGAAAAALVTLALPDGQSTRSSFAAGPIADAGPTFAPVREYRIPVQVDEPAVRQPLWIEARGARACVDMPAGTTLCVDPGTRMPVEREAFGDAPIVLSVVIGSVDVTTLDGVIHRVDSGQALDVERGVVSGEPPAEPEASRRPAGAKPRRAAAARPTADELLIRARGERRAHDIAASAKTYRKLIEEYPGSSPARKAMVTLGQDELDVFKRPKAALRLFDRYLSSGGTVLVEEALYHRARALRALGRKAGERDAIRRYLAKYPGGSYAVRMRQRLGALGAAGD